MMGDRRSCSPLRYPGGKQVLSKVLARLILENDASGGTYTEAYAGGAGAALNLLFDEHVNRIIINDADPSIYAFWRAALDYTQAFVDMIESTPLTIAEWKRQREIYRIGSRRYGMLKLGFATFYLNRCNRSGIVAGGGPIGGLKQKGKWKLDARFNRETLVARVQRVASYRERIAVTNLDAMQFVRTVVERLPAKARPFSYFDPPYFCKGQDLYMNHYAPEDHAEFAKYIRTRRDVPWVISYDDVEAIRRLYRPLRTVPLTLDYSARERRKGAEILILQPGLAFPKEWREGVPLGVVNGARSRRSRG
jgi:DNA adenine methylase